MRSDMTKWEVYLPERNIRSIYKSLGSIEMKQSGIEICTSEEVKLEKNRYDEAIRAQGGCLGTKSRRKT